MSGGVGRLAPGLVVALILAAAGPAVAAPDGCNMPAGVLEELEAFVTAQWNNGARVPGLAYEVGALGTTIEGEPDAVWRVAREAHEAVLAAGANGLVTVLKVEQTRDIAAQPTIGSLTGKWRA